MFKYVIGLKDSNRFDKFFSAEGAQGFKRFYGLDARGGYDVNIYDKTRFEAIMLREPANAEVGCTWSHLNVYRQFLSESTDDQDILIVAEDDALIDADIDSIVQKIFSKYPQLGAVVLSDGFAWESHTQNPYFVYSRISLLSRFIDSKHRVGPAAGSLSSTGLYAISRSAAAKIVELAESNGNRPYWVADAWDFFEQTCGFRVYALRPGLCNWVGDSLISDGGEPMYKVIQKLNSVPKNFVDKLRIVAAPRSRRGNFKNTLEATKKHLKQMCAR
ncbi:MAG: glycosyltransferase family 25 protein [Rothia sp. (in: high G+C Gram-positive bacteria)]|uniref:glycosyltransferase family 25 protein n=1 Tax=Rothia sp. (in: high G+C Gram-positive bacteria) TaxID=1885016 RepID=UPI0026DF90D6|nr:glycosyltransferase family 25 protein [Rothia sp. (in: high G+C Gram-positive bacteria)]MDO5750940.1 glycosyltransferase family 25 protein [Rothia sp. (in: high G+C Gram-positive bacteria)]